MRDKFLAFLYVFTFIFVIVFFTTFGLWNVFFQQDEWYWFGKALIAQKSGLISLIQVDGFHFNPLYPISFYLFYSLFRFNWVPYAIYSISLHTLNAFLLWILVKKITKKTVIAILSSFFFVIANVSQQAVTWYGASLNVLPAVTLGLLSLLAFLNFYETRKVRSFLLSYLFLLFSLGFKEDSMFLFIVYSLGFLFFKKMKSKTYFVYSVGIGFIYLVSRGLIQRFGTVNPISHINLLSYVSTILKNVFFIPLMSFSQLFFSPPMVYNLGRYITQGHEHFFLQFSTINNIEIFVETVFFTIITISLTILFLGLLALLIKTRKEVRVRSSLSLLVLFTFLSFSPFFLLPKGFGMESRHYYFPMVGGATLFGYVVILLWKKIKNIKLKYVFIGSLLIYLFYNYALDREQLQLVEELSKPRITFIHQIQKLYPNVGNNSVFLSKADYLPFQSGMGQMFMVLFDNRHQFDNLLSGYVLWDMGSQGYERSGNESFGYFSDKSLLRKNVIDHKIPLGNIYSFSWDNKSMILTDSTANIRKELIPNE